MLTGFIIGIIVMSILATIGALMLDNSNDLGLMFIGPAMWITLLFIFITEIVIRFIKGRTMSKYRFEELKNTDLYYGHIIGNWHAFRYYSNKKKHPIMYHWIVIERVKINE